VIVGYKVIFGEIADGEREKDLLTGLQALLKSHLYFLTLIIYTAV
jgi:hypothetical protein